MPAPSISIQPVPWHVRAARAVADEAVHRHLGARLDEREVRALQADPPLRPEQAPEQLEQRALQVRHVSPSSTASISTCVIIHSCVVSVASKR